MRQYAFLNGLIKDAFGSMSPDDSVIASATTPRALQLIRHIDVDFCAPLEPRPRLLINFSSITSPPEPTTNGEPAISLDDILNPPKEEDAGTSSTGHKPHLTSLTLDILPNADLQIVEHPFSGRDRSTADEGGKAAAERVARALDVCGELGIWVEWVAREEKRVAGRSK